MSIKIDFLPQLDQGQKQISMQHNEAELASRSYTSS